MFENSEWTKYLGVQIPFLLKTALHQLHLFNVRWLISSIADRVTALHRFLPLQRLPERDRAQVCVNSADGFPKEGPNFVALAAFQIAL